MYKIALLPLVFCIHIGYTLENCHSENTIVSLFEQLQDPFIDYVKKDLLFSFNLDKYKYAKDMSGITIFSHDYEQNDYIIFPENVNESNRCFILGKTDTAVERLKIALSLSHTCKYMYIYLQKAIKNQTKNIISEFLFSKITTDFLRLSFTWDVNRQNNNILDLYSMHPNVLFLIGKIILICEKKTWPQWRGEGDKERSDWLSSFYAKEGFSRFLIKHIENNRPKRILGFTIINPEKTNKYKESINAILKEIVKGIPFNEWITKLPRYHRDKNPRYITLPLIIKENNEEGYCILKTRSTLHN